MHASRVEALQAMPIFGGVSAEVLAWFVAGAGTVSVPKGDYFFREGDVADALYVLESGEVALVRQWAGEPHELARLGEGDCFGEMALLDLFPRSASVLALAPCTAIEVSSSSLHELYQTHLDQFALVQMNIARELSRRLRVADDRLFEAHVARHDPSAMKGFGLT
jgi:CRP-like cAMP-binding protein